MLEQRARVVGIDNGQLQLMPLQLAECPRCAAGNGCGGQLFGQTRGGSAPLTIAASEHISVLQGDVVVIGVAQQVLQKAALLLYGVPLLAMLLMAGLAFWLALPEAIQVLLVVLVLIGTFLWVRPQAARLAAQPLLSLLRRETNPSRCLSSAVST